MYVELSDHDGGASFGRGFQPASSQRSRPKAALAVSVVELPSAQERRL